MILKSYLIENDIKKINDYNFVLFYGENIGLKDDFKRKLTELFSKTELLNLYQEDFNKNKDILINEYRNNSLFAKEKTIIINQMDEKLIEDIKYLLENKQSTKLFIFTNMLEKKSKIRSLFEKDTTIAIIPCYSDNEITLKKYIKNELREFKNLSEESVRLIINFSNSERKIIKSHINKIKLLFENKNIDNNILETLLNSDKNELFENIRDAALKGDKEALGKLLNNFIFNKEDIFYYFNSINSVLLRLYDLQKERKETESLEETLNNAKPPIFWKDKNKFQILLKKWSKYRLYEALNHLSKIEKKMKSQTEINPMILVKNSLINICSNSWSYF